MRRGAVLLFVVSLLFAACSSDGDPDPEDSEPDVSQVDEAPAGSEAPVESDATAASSGDSDDDSGDDDGGNEGDDSDEGSSGGLTGIDGPAQVDDDSGADG